MVDDLWNDNRRLERLLKTEVGATSVALGMASPACVCWSVCGCVCLYGMDLIFSVGIQSYSSSHNRSCHVCSTDLFTLLLWNYRKTQTMFTPVMAAQWTTVFLRRRGTQQAVLRFVPWCVGWDHDVWVETVMCGLKGCLKYGCVSVTVCKKDHTLLLLSRSPYKSYQRGNC